MRSLIVFSVGMVLFLTACSLVDVNKNQNGDSKVRNDVVMNENEKADVKIGPKTLDKETAEKVKKILNGVQWEQAKVEMDGSPEAYLEYKYSYDVWFQPEGKTVELVSKPSGMYGKITGQDAQSLYSIMTLIEK